MINFKKINLKNHPPCFSNDMININDVDANLLTIDKMSFKSTDAIIYDIKSMTVKGCDSESINSENPLCLTFNEVDTYIINENDGYKFLIFVSTNKDKKVLRRYAELFDQIENQIEATNGGKLIKYKKDLRKIRFDSDDNDLPLGKILNIPVLIIIVKSVFSSIIHKFIYISV